MELHGAHPATQPAPDAAPSYPRLLRLRAVKDRTGKSKSSIYEDPTFPRPVKIGPRAVAWVASEVDAWCAERIAARDAEVARA